MGRSRGELTVAAVLIVCLVLAGCSSGEPQATTDADRTAETTGTAETAGATGTTAEIDGVAPTTGTSRPALATRVIDGDTVEVRYRNGETDTVRLLGVDTPEVSGDVNPEEFEGIPDTEAGRDHLREWATRASAFARERLEGEEVTVVVDPRADRRDRYGRLLAYVVRSGEGGGSAEGSEASDGGGEGRTGRESFNAALLRGGYARVYESTFTERAYYERIEARAQQRNAGLWGFEGDEETTGGASNARLVVARIQADAPGDDNENPNGEYVVLANRGSERRDLSGWQVADEGGHTYVVPEGVTLDRGSRITLYSGRGADGGAELYWGSSGAIWNNGGDTVTVRDASGTVVARRSYGS